METYKVGNEIGYCTSRNHHSAAFLRLDTIAKVNKNQIVITNGRKFSRNTGKEIKSEKNEFPSAYLVEVGIIKNAIAEENKVHERTQIIGGLRDKLAKRSMIYRMTDAQIEMCKNLLQELGGKS